MVTTNNVKGTNLSDKDIASDMLKDSKFGISTISKAAAEATNSELRKMLNGHLTATVHEHHRLSDIAINKDWYKAFETPQQQLKNENNEVTNMIK